MDYYASLFSPHRHLPVIVVEEDNDDDEDRNIC